MTGHASDRPAFTTYSPDNRISGASTMSTTPHFLGLGSDLHRSVLPFTLSSQKRYTKLCMTMRRGLGIHSGLRVRMRMKLRMRCENVDMEVDEVVNG